MNPGEDILSPDLIFKYSFFFVILMSLGFLLFILATQL